MKKNLKLVVMIIEILFIIITLSSSVFAKVPTISEATKWGEIMTERDVTDDDGRVVVDEKGNPKKEDYGITKKTENVVGAIVQLIQIVGYGISIIMLVYVGIKYMTAAPSEKAEFKKSATAYVVGAVVLFGASSIITLIAKFATANLK